MMQLTNDEDLVILAWCGGVV